MHRTASQGLVALTVLLLAPPARLQAGEPPLFSVIPPDKVAFNYPAPPQEDHPGYFAIAEGGQARCVIVHPAKRASHEALLAASLLKRYLDLSTGADIALVEDGKPLPAGLAAIHVGDTAVSKDVELNLPDVRYGDDAFPNLNGYLLKTLDPHTLVIRGGTERAHMLGVVGFLKRYVGWRHYWAGHPGDLGDVLPKQPTLRLPRIEWRDWPYFLSRTMSGVNQNGPAADAQSGAFVRTDEFFRLHSTIPSNESFYRWLPLEKYGATHPEFFPLADGKRFVPVPAAEGGQGRAPAGGWQPCVSNPQVVQIMADGLIRYFRDHPDEIAINLAVNDGMGDCQCPECRAMDAPQADYGQRIGLCDRYVKFENQVAERVAREFPHKIIAFIAYGSMRRPPTTVKLHPMLMPVLCCGGTVNAFANWDEWMKTGARHMGAYLYHDDILYFILPKIDLHQSARRIRYFVASGRARHFYQEMYSCWPLDGMVCYLENELLWDPRQDEDALLEEYYAKFFGPAAGPMKRFYEALESGYQRWLEEQGVLHSYGRDLGSMCGGRSFEQFKVLNPQEADRAEAALKEAVSAARDDPLVSQRVGIVRGIFGFVALGARLYGNMTGLQESKVTSEAEARQVVAAARQAVTLARAWGDYKRDVAEQPPVCTYYTHKAKDSTNPFYDSIEAGQVHGQAGRAIAVGLGAAAECLRTQLGPQRADAWWQAQRAGQTDPLLQAAFSVAAAKARGVQLVNLVRDPSFEQRGAGHAPEGETILEPDHEVKNGVHFFRRRGTQCNCTLTTEDAHSGKYSVCFAESQYAALSESVRAAPGDCLSISVWVKHNEKKGAYQITLTPAGSGGKLPKVTIPVPDKPGEWQQISTDFTMPAGAGAICMHVFAAGQTVGAKLWIDEVFMGKYPE